MTLPELRTVFRHDKKLTHNTSENTDRQGVRAKLNIETAHGKQFAKLFLASVNSALLQCYFRHFINIADTIKLF